MQTKTQCSAKVSIFFVILLIISFERYFLFTAKKGIIKKIWLEVQPEAVYCLWIITYISVIFSVALRVYETLKEYMYFPKTPLSYNLKHLMSGDFDFFW